MRDETAGPYSAVCMRMHLTFFSLIVFICLFISYYRSAVFIGCEESK